MSGLSLKSALYGVCTALALVAFTGTAALAAPPLNESQRQIEAIAVPDSELRVDAWLDHADAEYAIGDTLQLFVRTNKDAYVTIFNVDAEGVVRIVFPNAFEDENLIAANSVVQIPAADAKFALQVGGPTGANLIKIVASTEDMSFTESIDFAVSGGFRAYEGDIMSLSRQITAVIQEEEDAAWASEELTVAVTEETAGIQQEQGPSVIISQESGISGGVAPPEGADALSEPESGFGLFLSLQGDEFRAGDSLSMSVAAERECQLRIVDVDAKGNATILFPNAAQGDDMLQPGTVAFLPGVDSGVEYQVNGAPGTHAIVALCTIEDSPILTELLGKARTSVTVLNHDSVMELADSVNQLPAENVARAVATYEIVR